MARQFKILNVSIREHLIIYMTKKCPKGKTAMGIINYWGGGMVVADSNGRYERKLGYSNCLYQNRKGRCLRPSEIIFSFRMLVR